MFKEKVTIKGVLIDDFVNYKKPSMTILMPYCSFKCGEDLCQNSSLAKAPLMEVKISNLLDSYLDNEITQALVFSGLEPFDSWEDLISIIQEFRLWTDDDIVIYTGYNESEIAPLVFALSSYKNIYIKFGRYLPGRAEIYDPLLKVTLASDNQYTIKTS